MLPVKQAAIYCRISNDRVGAGLGVARQEQDCRTLAAGRGWEVARVHVDNDISAYSGKLRPAYRQLLEEVRSGAVQAVITWHPDRLHRSTRELEEFIDVINAAHADVATVQGGVYDMSTASGRMTAKIVGAVSQQESEHKAERLRRKHLQLAEQGQDAGSGRPFGYESDRRTVRRAEAELVREAARRVLEGEALRSVCRDWNARGVETVSGTRWTVTVLRRMLCSARISGRRDRKTVDGKRRLVGLDPVTATWKGMISVDDSDRLRALLSDPERQMNRGRPAAYLLTGGIARCGICGTALVSRPKAPGRPAMVCASGPGFHGCGGIRIMAEPLERLVSEAVLLAVEGGALAQALESAEDRAALAELEGVNAKLAELAGDYGADRITRGEWEQARAVLSSREKALQRRLQASRWGVGLANLPDPLRAAWPTLPLHLRRTVISAVVEAVIVGPAVRGRNTFSPERVSIRWR